MSTNHKGASERCVLSLGLWKAAPQGVLGLAQRSTGTPGRPGCPAPCRCCSCFLLFCCPWVRACSPRSSGDRPRPHLVPATLPAGLLHWGVLSPRFPFPEPEFFLSLGALWRHWGNSYCLRETFFPLFLVPNIPSLVPFLPSEKGEKVTNGCLFGWFYSDACIFFFFEMIVCGFRHLIKIKMEDDTH